MRYYLVWLTSELTEYQQRWLGLHNPGVLGAHWNGWDMVWMDEWRVELLERIGVVHLKEEVREDEYREGLSRRWKIMRQMRRTR